MGNIAVIVDASGSLLASAKAQLAGECLRVLLQEKIIMQKNVYRWQENTITSWPQDGWPGGDAWEGSFCGSCNLAVLADFLKEEPEHCLVVSDGYVFQDASMAEQHFMRQFKGRLKLLLLEQERKLAALKRFFTPESVYAPDEILILAERLSGSDQAAPMNIEALSFAMAVPFAIEAEEEDKWT